MTMTTTKMNAYDVTAILESAGFRVVPDEDTAEESSVSVVWSVEEVIAHFEGDNQAEILPLSTAGAAEIVTALVRYRYGGSRTAKSGTHLIGAGPAREGWAAYTAAGDGIFLGATDGEAIDRLLMSIGELREKGA